MPTIIIIIITMIYAGKGVANLLVGVDGVALSVNENADPTVPLPTRCNSVVMMMMVVVMAPTTSL